MRFYTSTLLLIFFAILSFSLCAQKNTNKPKEPFKLEASYVGDQANNFSGGIKTGSCYLGMVNLRIGFDAEKAGLWKGGSFYMNAANTHGATPSASLLGDMQVASNIEAGNHTFFQELFYQHTFSKVDLIIGLQDLNVEFASSENGALFLNSSFGILPLISGNISAPIFPLTSLGLTAKWTISENTSWINAVYDGSPTNFDYNPYNLNWQFNTGDGILAISEFQYTTKVNNLPGTYKVGIYSHNHLLEKSLDRSIPDSIDFEVFGIYTYADQQIWEQDHQYLNTFVQLGYSPNSEITNDVYFGMGFNFSGLFNSKGKDILGLAIGYEHFTNSLKSETVIELSYQYEFNQNIYIQPDFQYIINPAGTGETLDNAFAGIFRFGLTF